LNTLFFKKSRAPYAIFFIFSKKMPHLKKGTERLQNEEQFRASLAEKEALLQEIHHRVKNNLQLISSLLHLQAKNPGKKDPGELFVDSENRIRSLTLIHESLYQSKNFSRIEFAGYLRELLVRLLQAYKKPGQAIEGAVTGNEIFLDITRAIPCGLIANELISNALKHAFPGGRQGEILVAIMKEGDQISLSVKDNGVGLPPDFNLQDKHMLGLQIMTTLVNQLGGEMAYSVNLGTEFTLTF
jgi:two-component sensor histidine kinase